MVAAKKLIYYLIPLIVLILIVMWQFGPEGLFEGMKEAVKGIVKMAPEIGAEEIEVVEVQLSEEQLDSINSLEQTIKLMLDSSEENCFKQYKKFPSLKENNVLIEFEYLEGKTTMIVRKGEEHRLVDKVVEIPRMKPCVIAGPKNTHEKANDKVIAENFYDNFLGEDSECKGCDMWDCPEGCAVPYWTKSKQIIIKEKETIVYDGTEGDFEDGGWLYKNNNGYICFFPTVDGNNICDGSDEDGLDDDCLGEDPDEDTSIPRQVREGKLITC